MKSPFYVIDHARKIIVGQFFQEQSAIEVRELLQSHTAKPGDVYLMNAQHVTPDDYYVRTYKHADEKMLQAIAAETKLIEPEMRKTYNCVVAGAVVKSSMFGELLIAVKILSNGPKFETWYMVGVDSNQGYKYKVRTMSVGPAFIRMATIDEWAKANGKKEEREARIEQRKETNDKTINVLDLKVGDTVTVQYSNGAHDEKVIDINYATGRVAIQRRGYSAGRYEKRRFIDAKHISKVVSKAV